MAETYQVRSNRGWTAKIYDLPGDPPRVCKAFKEDCAETHYPVERKAYERFAARDHPSSILTYYGVHEDISFGIVLELAEKGDLLEYLEDEGELGHERPRAAVLYRWAKQAAEALAFAHSCGVYNSDIHCVNFVLDRDLNLKVADWAGASIDGSRSWSSYRLEYRLFDADGNDVPRRDGITVETEIFAFGTALYHMITGHLPWPELDASDDRQAIKSRIRTKSFPDTDRLPVLADVIVRCWHVEFASMSEVVRAIEHEKQCNS